MPRSAAEGLCRLGTEMLPSELYPRRLRMPLGGPWYFYVWKLLRYVRLCSPWTVAHLAPLFMGFARQKYRSGQPFLFPGGAPNPGIEPRSPALQVDSLPAEQPGKPMVFLQPTLKNLVALQHAWTSKCVCILCWQSLHYVKQKNVICKKCHYKSGFLLHIKMNITLWNGEA